MRQIKLFFNDLPENKNGDAREEGIAVLLWPGEGREAFTGSLWAAQGKVLAYHNRLNGAGRCTVQARTQIFSLVSIATRWMS